MPLFNALSKPFFNVLSARCLAGCALWCCPGALVHLKKDTEAPLTIRLCRNPFAESVVCALSYTEHCIAFPCLCSLDQSWQQCLKQENLLEMFIEESRLHRCWM